MDVDSPLIYDEFPPFTAECTTFDDFDEFLPKTEPIDFFTDHINQQHKPEINFTCDNNFEGNIPIEIKKQETFNPDEFLNFYQSDNQRNTPSPTNSSTSNSSFSSDSNSLPSTTSTSSSSNNKQNVPKPLINMILDTPPISPSESNYCNSTVNQFQQQVINGGSVKLLQGTIIPISKLPNLVVNNKAKENHLNFNQKPKTILLSSKDFKNLMERYNVKKNSIIAPPKIIVKQNSVDKTMPIHQKIAAQQQKQLPQSNINAKILPKPELKMINSIIDEKTLKKQQRMIKNRKSACLSRMKKKDYVASLEQKLNDLKKENSVLKVENTSLRCQLDTFTKQCLCNCKRKFNDIISLNNNNNRNSLNLNKILMGSALRKNTAVLLAMIFMVSINFGTINNFLNPRIDFDINKIQNSLPKQSKIAGEHYGVRSLLWINDSVNNSTNLPNALPLHRIHLNNKKLCPMYINQTENLRLASELQKWIDTNDYLNLSTPIIRPFKYPSDYINPKNTEYQILFKNINNFDIFMKKNKKNYFNRNVLRKNKMKLNNSQKLNIENNTNPIEVFQPKLQNKYTKLFEEIRRRDDTFYVVSFNTEHILLPASAYNKSSRPKMSLMLPASDTLLNGKFTLMQIDCEVLNTTLVELKEELIPKNLRPKFNTNNNHNHSVNNVPTRAEDKNTTKTDSSVENVQFDLLNKKNFNNFTKPHKLLNRIRKYQHEINDLSEVEVDDNEFNKKTDKFNHIYKPYFINTQSKGDDNITNDVKINDNNLLP